MGKRIWIVACAVALAIAGAVAYRFFGGDPSGTPAVADGAPAVRSGEPGGGAARAASAARPAAVAGDAPDAEGASGPDGTPADEEEPLTEEEKAEAEAEAKVEAFDNLTDKWMDPSPTPVTMKDVDGFVAAFRAVPKDRQDECIHRALNLIPDENVMLLAGVLMDKAADKEIVEAVFNDVLNRDEDVKQPILKQIYADKKHPCWADTAWILDVTGEKPERDEQ